MSDASDLLVQPAPELATLEVTGKDRLTWLDGLVTCALKDKRAGDGAYGLVVQKTGKIQAELWVVVRETALWLGVRNDLAAEVTDVLDKHLVMEDAEVARADRAWIFVHGPRARELLPTARAAPKGTAVQAACDAAEIDWTGLGGIAVVAPAAESATVRDALLAAAAKLGPAALATDEAWDALRVGALVPRWGVDFSPGCYPQEAAIEGRAVSFEKGCYLGQEAVYMLEKRGHVKQRLVLLRVAGAAAPGAEVASADGPVGRVTSVVPVDGATLAIAMVKYKHAFAGASLTVGGAAATVERGLAQPAA